MIHFLLIYCNFSRILTSINKIIIIILHISYFFIHFTHSTFLFRKKFYTSVRKIDVIMDISNQDQVFCLPLYIDKKIPNYHNIQIQRKIFMRNYLLSHLKSKIFILNVIQLKIKIKSHGDGRVQFKLSWQIMAKKLYDLHDAL